MAETIIITTEEREQTVIPERESVVIADTETRSVLLDMADGNQVISPHAGKVMSQVTVRKPSSMKSFNIKNGVTIGGVEGTYKGEALPPLDTPAVGGDVLAGKEFLVRLNDYSTMKGTGSLQTSTPSVNLYMVSGDQIINAPTGTLMSSVTIQKPVTLIPEVIKKDIPIGGVVGTYEGTTLEPLDTPASPGDVLAGKEYYDDEGTAHEGTFALPSSAESAGADQVVSGKKFVGWTGEIKTGTMNPDEWDNDFLNIYRQTVTVDTTETSTGSGVRDYLYAKLGLTVTNRLIGFGLRKPTTYTENEIVRYAAYPNANHCTIAKYSNGSFVSGSLSGAAPLITGRVYDVFYWLGHNPGEEPTR